MGSAHTLKMIIYSVKNGVDVNIIVRLYNLKKELQTWISLVFVLFHMAAIQTSFDEQMFICQRRIVETWEKE